MSGGHHLGRHDREQPDQESAQCRAQRKPQLQTAEQRFTQCDAAHDQNTRGRAQEPDQGRDDEIVRRDDHAIGCDNSDFCRREGLRDEVTDER